MLCAEGRGVAVKIYSEKEKLILEPQDSMDCFKLGQLSIKLPHETKFVKGDGPCELVRMEIRLDHLLSYLMNECAS